jgi:hypothetical protein
MPTATLTTATVEVIGKPKTSKYEGKPPYRPVLFNLADGSQVWKSYSEGAPELEWLTTGETYQATIAGEEVTLIAPATAPTAPTATPQATAQAPSQGKPASQGTSLDAMTGEEKAQIASYITSVSALYAYCYQQAAHHLSPHGAPEPAIQAAASTTFIQASRKFSL